MTRLEAIKLGLELVKLGPDLAAGVKDIVDKVKGMPTWQQRRAAVDAAQAAVDEQLLRQHYRDG